MKIPLLDLKRQYLSIKAEIDSALQRAVSSQSFILGPEVESFEKAVAQYCSVKNAIGVASGTDALIVALRALGVGPGDAVLLPTFTFFATAGAVANLGAIPVFAEIDPATFNLDPTWVRKRLEKDADLRKRAKAMIPVHLFGQMAEMDDLMGIAREFHLSVVEDAAQSIGSKYKNRSAGSIGNCGTLSFFPSKNLGGFGDGGMIVTQDDLLAEKIRMLRVHGAKKTYVHKMVGFNSRLDAIQAAVLGAKLPHLEAWSEKRAKNADSYRELLQEIPSLVLPALAPQRRHIYNQFTLRIQNGRRDQFKEFLDAQGVGNAIYYPIPLHLQECFAYLGGKPGDLPHAEQAAKEVISIPVFPELTEEEIRRVAEKIREFR